MFWGMCGWACGWMRLYDCVRAPGCLGMYVPFCDVNEDTDECVTETNRHYGEELRNAQLDLEW
jgi:hypothetical protein